MQIHETRQGPLCGRAIDGDTLCIADTNDHRILTVDLGSRKARALDFEDMDKPTIIGSTLMI